jgi:hypothetical protein
MAAGVFLQQLHVIGCVHPLYNVRRTAKANIGPPFYFTVRFMLPLWLLNSGAYRHWISATPVWYAPRSWTRVEYSNT